VATGDAASLLRLVLAGAADALTRLLTHGAPREAAEAALALGALARHASAHERLFSCGGVAALVACLRSRVRRFPQVTRSDLWLRRAIVHQNITNTTPEKRPKSFSSFDGPCS
jgi:hypothetical protein